MVIKNILLSKWAYNELSKIILIIICLLKLLGLINK